MRCVFEGSRVVVDQLDDSTFKQTPAKMFQIVKVFSWFVAFSHRPVTRLSNCCGLVRTGRLNLRRLADWGSAEPVRQVAGEVTATGQDVHPFKRC